VGLPGILVQDSYRFAFFSRGEGKRAFDNDLLWGVLQTGALLVLAAAGHVTIVSCLLVFGGSATVAAAFGWWQLGLAPELSRTKAWLREQGTLSGRYFVENVAIGGARQVRIVTLGVVAGLTAVAELRAAEIIMGPFMVLLAGISQVSVPEARSVLVRDSSRFRRFCLTLGAVQAAGAAAWSIAVIIILPLGPGELLLKELWEPSRRLLIPLSLIFILGGFEAAAAAGVRALGASRRSLKAQLSNAGLYVVLGGIGAELGGAWGSSWGVVVGLVGGLTVWWIQLARGIRDHTHSEVEHP
jgi:O-antigen/teichoic acid export membrane protein